MRNLIAACLVLAPLAVAQQSELAALLEGGHYKRVRAIAELRVKQNPRDAEALYAMGRVRQAYNDVEGAHSYAERAVAADGSKAPYHCLLGETSGSKAEKAGAFSKFGLGRAVKKEAEAGLALDPRYAPCYHLLIAFHLKAPGIIGGDKNKAKELADKLLSLDPVEGNYAQARLVPDNQRAQKDPHFEKAAQANPKSYKANVQVAGVYATQKKMDLAEKHARDALRIDPSRQSAYSLLAQFAVMQDKWAELDSILMLAEKAVPDNLNPHFQAARVAMIRNKELASAEKFLRKYLTQEPEGGAPTWANARWVLGLVLEKAGRRAEAKSELRAAVSLDPALEGAKKDLDRLK